MTVEPSFTVITDLYHGPEVEHCQPQQHPSSPVVLGSNPKHTIYVFRDLFNLLI